MCGVPQAPSVGTVCRKQSIAGTSGLISTRTRAVRADQQTDVVDTALLQTIAQITQTVDNAVATTMAASAEAAQSLNLSTNSELRDKVCRAVEKLQQGLLERETEVSLILG
jgi:hypothetical protein